MGLSRRVAPDAVMGLYTPDEITEGKYVEVTDFPVEVVEETEKQPEKDQVPMASEAQVKAIHAIITAKSPDSDHLLWVNDALGLIGKEEELEHVSIETITREMAQNLFNKFETLKWSKPRGK